MTHPLTKIFTYSHSLNLSLSLTRYKGAIIWDHSLSKCVYPDISEAVFVTIIKMNPSLLKV